MFAEDAQEYASLLHPPAGFFASRKGERTVLTTTKMAAKDEDLSGAAAPGGAGVMLAPRARSLCSLLMLSRLALAIISTRKDTRHGKRKDQRP
jgi:hypothetical protein